MISLQFEYFLLQCSQEGEERKKHLPVPGRSNSKVFLLHVSTTDAATGISCRFQQKQHSLIHRMRVFEELSPQKTKPLKKPRPRRVFVSSSRSAGGRRTGQWPFETIGGVSPEAVGVAGETTSCDELTRSRSELESDTEAGEPRPPAKIGRSRGKWGWGENGLI